MTARRRLDVRPVALRFLSRDLPVELYGDFVHWMEPTTMERRGSAQEWQATVHLPAGVYAYKFRTYDGAWHLDGDNPRTRSTDGCRNSLLVLSGSDEPVLHAPCFPFAFVLDGGQLLLRAGLRRGNGDRLILRQLPPHNAAALGYSVEDSRDFVMQKVAEEDEHLLFEARIPIAVSTLDYLFVLESGRRVGNSGQALRVKLPALRDKLPAFWQKAVIYTVFIDRFRRGSGTLTPTTELPDEEARCGGDLHGVREALPYLAALGVTVLHLTPICLSHSAHRYDAVNPRVVDPALGGEDALIALLNDAHRLGLRVLLDVVLTHVHRDFLPFCDVRLRGQASPYADWFYVERHPFFEGLGPGYRHYQKGRWQEPLLRTDNEEVIAYLEDVVRHFARLGVDGFRLDAAADVPLSLLLRLRDAARAERPDAVLFGEVTPDNTWRFTASALDAATDFSHQQVLYDWLWHRRIDAKTAAHTWRRRAFARGPDATAVVFSATHDQPRFLTLTRDVRRARLAQIITLLGPATPALYYGDEVDLHSHEPERAFEDVWPDRAPMPWDVCDEVTRSLIRDALRLRREHPALHAGDVDFLDGECFAFRRRAGDDVVEIYVNDDESSRIQFLFSGPSGSTLLLACGEAVVDGDCVRLGPLSAAVIARHAPPHVTAAWQTAIEKNAQLCAATFRAGQLASLSLPSQLYLTVTERCNLRCGHCITAAPARTASGQARTMQPWLLDVLEPALAAADYFGFVHGGESLVAPIFFELLRRIQRARAGRRYDAHLLSNGMLLDGDAVKRLCELGVTSLAVSLDGGSAATNDSLRIGADFEKILDNLASAIAIRKQLGADLRIGVSTVLTQSNLHELLELGARLIALGVDWIKVEEVYPVNALSRLELLPPRGRRATTAVQALRELAQSSSVIIVDHLAPPSGCPCAAAQRSGSDALSDFRRSDDFANRTCFLLCRAAWQQACVDPDGTVHAVDYFQPPLGSLIDAPFLSLWQGDRAMQQRAAALARIDPALRRSCAR